jgi:phospholipid/cholesterol/gamma-HCH transport system substrate-binding protein
MRRVLPLHQRALIGGIGTLFVAAGTTLAVQAAFGAFDGGYELVGTFERAGQGLDDASDVKMRGVTVGEVESIELDDQGQAVVTLRINDGVRVPDTTSAAIAPISVFGPTYVQLDPGDHERSGPFLADGDAIAETQAPVEFTEVLSDGQRLLEAIDPQELGIIISELADGLRGTGDDIGAMVEHGSTLVDLAAAHDDDTELFLRDLALLGQELATRGDDMVAAADGLAAGLSPIAEHPDEFGALLGDTQRVATELADLLRGHRDAIGDGITAGALATEVVVAHLADLPGYLDSLATYFDVLGRTIRIPGPGGATLATQKFFLPDDLCLFLICPDGVGVTIPLPEAPPPGTPPTQLPPPPGPPIVEVPPVLEVLGPR